MIILKILKSLLRGLNVYRGLPLQRNSLEIHFEKNIKIIDLHHRFYFILCDFIRIIKALDT